LAAVTYITPSTTTGVTCSCAAFGSVKIHFGTSFDAFAVVI
jgi:hypothetical protein